MAAVAAGDGGGGWRALPAVPGPYLRSRTTQRPESGRKQVLVPPGRPLSSVVSLRRGAAGNGSRSTLAVSALLGPPCSARRRAGRFRRRRVVGGPPASVGRRGPSCSAPPSRSVVCGCPCNGWCADAIEPVTEALPGPRRSSDSGPNRAEARDWHRALGTGQWAVGTGLALTVRRATDAGCSRGQSVCEL